MITKEQIENAIRTFTYDPAANLELIVEALVESDKRSADMWVALQQCRSVFSELADYMKDPKNPPLFTDAEKCAYMYANMSMAVDGIREIMGKYGGKGNGI